MESELELKPYKEFVSSFYQSQDAECENPSPGKLYVERNQCTGGMKNCSIKSLGTFHDQTSYFLIQQVEVTKL